MMSLRFAAAAVMGAAILALAGCASEQQAVASQAAEARNPCTGVAPATGSLIRRKEDCGGASGGGIPDDVRQEIERTQRNRVGRPAIGSGG